MTGDVWAFLKHIVTERLAGQREREARAFLEQAAEFFDVASNPRIGSKPLLYYYSFLNLAKMALLFRGVPLPPGPRHGIADPRANTRTRLRLEGQRVQIDALAPNHSRIFPEFIRMLGGDATAQRNLKVIDLLEQIPSIHRTFIRVTRRKASFVPITRAELQRDGGDLWVRVVFREDDKDVKDTLPRMRRRRGFRRALHQVDPPEDIENEIWYETQPAQGRRRGVDTAIKAVVGQIRDAGIWTILTSDGYRCYLWCGEPRKALPPLAAVYAVIFYLGSITRYKPYDFDRIVAGRNSLLVSEILASQPVQFVYGLASHVAGVDVVKPYATLD